MMEYQWFYPKTENDIIELLAAWEYVGWHPFYHAVMMSRLVEAKENCQKIKIVLDKIYIF